MSIATLVLGESGTGKTCSLRNFDPSQVLLIQPVRKPLPFRSQEWREIAQRGDGGNIYVCPDPSRIVQAMRRTTAPVVIIDDWQYILASMFMARRSEKGYDKFTDIGGVGFDVAKTASELAPTTRCYILAHTTVDDFGHIRIKTLGKLLDDKIVVEGMFTTVLRTVVDGGEFYFSTQNNGMDTVKSPMHMFDDALIPNDLAAVDETICDYYGIENTTPVIEAKNGRFTMESF